MSPALELALRLLAAGLLGAAVGYERELRSKGAGLRTHILVSLGSALFMIISQYGFEGAARFDAARVAAGVVGGLGFLGGGIIMKNKHVSGLTTAAGLWVTGAIGLAAGSGMYAMAGLCTLLVLISLEALHFYSFKLGDKEVKAVLASDDRNVLISAVEGLGKQVSDFTLTRSEGTYKMELQLRIKKRESALQLLERLDEIPGVKLECME